MKHYKPESHVGFDHVEMCHAVAVRSAWGAFHHVRRILRAPQCRNRPTCHQIYKHCSCYTPLFHMTQWPLLPNILSPVDQYVSFSVNQYHSTMRKLFHNSRKWLSTEWRAMST